MLINNSPEALPPSHRGRFYFTSKNIDDLYPVFPEELSGYSARIAGWRPLGKNSLADAIAAADIERPFSLQLKGICNVCPGDRANALGL